MDLTEAEFEVTKKSKCKCPEARTNLASPQDNASAAGTQEETAVARLLGPDQGIWIQGEIEEGVAETSTAWQTMRKRLDFIRNVMRDFQQRGDAI